MKTKRFLPAIAICLAACFLCQSCIGSFSLTNKVLQWNKNVNNKLVNELVFFAFWVLPVYEVTSIADLLVINSIEFWSGNKPLESDNKVIKTDEGDYFIAVSEKGYEISSPDGKTISFEFDSESQTWSLDCGNGEKTDFLRYTDPDNVQVLDRNGEFVDIPLTQDGIDRYISMIGMPTMANL